MSSIKVALRACRFVAWGVRYVAVFCCIHVEFMADADAESSFDSLLLQLLLLAAHCNSRFLVAAVVLMLRGGHQR